MPKSTLLVSIICFQQILVAQTMSPEDRWVDSTLSRMTVEEKVGQLLVADFVAVYSHEESENFARIKRQIKDFHIGGIILASGAVFDITVMLNELQRVSKLPIVVSADLEAGLGFWRPWRYVQGRAPDLPKFIPAGGTAFPGNMALGATGNEKYAYEVGRVTGEEARAVGIHWTLAPVVDVNNNPKNPVINVRSFGEEPALVAKLGAAFVGGCQDSRQMATAKHFPGHGDTDEDSHMRLPIVNFTMDRLSSIELIPFKKAIAVDVKSIMTAHLALPKIDSTRRPATLSKPILTDLLRDSLQFQGIIVTDGLTMQGITDKFSVGEAALSAILAGADALLVPPDIENAYHGLLDAVKSKKLSEKRLDESIRRILSVKAWLGLHKNRFVDVGKVMSIVASPQNEELARRISRDAITLLENKKETIPISKKPGLKISVVVLSDGSSRERGRDFVESLRLRYSSVVVFHVNRATGANGIQEAVTSAKRSDLTLLPIYVSPGAWKGELRFPSTVKNFLRQAASIKKPMIAISFGDPYIVSELPNLNAVICAYTGLSTMEAAVVDAIRGDTDIRGKLPVTIPPRYSRGDGIQYRVAHQY